MPDTQKYLLYSIADFFNKAIYSIALQNNLSLNAGVAVESNHVGRTYNLCNMPLWAKTHVVLSGAYGFYSTFNGIFLLSLLEKSTKTCTRAICTERIMAATFGRLLDLLDSYRTSVEVKLSVKQNGS
jgi:hypothetical protein